MGETPPNILVLRGLFHHFQTLEDIHNVVDTPALYIEVGLHLV